MKSFHPIPNDTTSKPVFLIPGDYTTSSGSLARAFSHNCRITECRYNLTQDGSAHEEMHQDHLGCLRFAHGVIGFLTEANELHEWLTRDRDPDAQKSDRDYLLLKTFEEIGDMFYYYALMDSFVLDAHIEKIFPDFFASYATTRLEKVTDFLVQDTHHVSLYSLEADELLHCIRNHESVLDDMKKFVFANRMSLSSEKARKRFISLTSGMLAVLQASTRLLMGMIQQRQREGDNWTIIPQDFQRLHTLAAAMMCCSRKLLKGRYDASGAFSEAGSEGRKIGVEDDVMTAELRKWFPAFIK